VTLKYVIDNHKSPDIYLITNEARFLYAPQLGQWSIHLDKVIIQDESFELPELEKLSGNQRLYGEVSFALNVSDPGAFRLYLAPERSHRVCRYSPRDIARTVNMVVRPWLGATI